MVTSSEAQDRGLIPINGRKLKAVRKARGWSQKELAARSGVSRSYISDIEMGRRSPRPVMFRQIAQTLSCDVGDLVPSSDLHWVMTELPDRRTTDHRP